MTAPQLTSHAQNGEDVVLWRALHRIDQGRYVEVGANSPLIDSISRAFYDAGWSGITVEPVPEFSEAHRTQRPRDIQVQAAVTSADVEEIVLYDIPSTGLSTAVADISARHRHSGFSPREITVPARALRDILDEHLEPGAPVHFMTVDTEGSERPVLESMDFTRWRPWVLVVEATAPNTNTPTHGAWEDLVLSAGYRFVLFDGLSRFYVAEEHADELAADLSYPACALDKFVLAEGPQLPIPVSVTEHIAALESQVAHAHDTLHRSTHEVIRWRALAIEGLTKGSATTASSPDAEQQLAAIQRTISWRITAPLRRLRPRLNREVALAIKVKNRARLGR